MSSALITGSAGFVGFHLGNHLLENEWDVAGYDFRKPANRLSSFEGDICDRDSILRTLMETKPDIIFHLAGLLKSKSADELYRIHIMGTLALFESIMEIGYRPVVVVASSSAVYGSGFQNRPISEKFKPHPLTHYAVSKLAQESVSLRYFDAFQLPVIVVRMFNLLGPGQSPDLACSAFARQIALAEERGEDEILTGDLSAHRDFVDIRDAVKAFALLSENGKAGQIYNVCSERAVLMRKCLDEMLSLSPRQFKVRVDANRVQKHDVLIQVGNARKLNRVTRWRPRITLKQSLTDLLDYWRQRIRAGLE